MSIKAVVFDLGNVIINYNLLKFIDAYAKNIPEAKMQHIDQLILEYSSVAYLYETGKISSEEFYEMLKKETHYGASFNEFSFIWNDIFDSPNKEVVDIIKKLSGKYKLSVLSTQMSYTSNTL